MSEIKDDLDTLSEMVEGKESSFFSTEGFNGNEIAEFIYGKDGIAFLIGEGNDIVLEVF